MLKVAYSIFLGILLTVFVGVGVATFYPRAEAPEYPVQSTINGELTAEQNAAVKQYYAESDAYDKNSHNYDRNVSIIFLIASIFFVVISIFFAKKIHVLADGIMLGGLFTLLYSIGLSFNLDDSKYTFIITSAGLVIAGVLGYYRFAKEEVPAKSNTTAKK